MSNSTESLLVAIRAALTEGADSATKRQGAEAAKTIATLLSATPGAPLVEPSPAPTALGQAVQQMRHAPQTVVLDALIAKLRTLLPEEEGDAISPTQGPALNIPFVRFPGGTPK